ncbi:hypothetical protein GLI01_12610 [Gluconacetobacter liquefaciens]|nr:hypothetical protein GLI01_12610 [Gluconacetobacter liquefaciens]
MPVQESRLRRIGHMAGRVAFFASIGVLLAFGLYLGCDRFVLSRHGHGGPASRTIYGVTADLREG